MKTISEYQSSNTNILPNILIVDDLPANLRLLEMMFVDRGYTIRTVLSGNLALQAASAEPPDLILLDINMPKMDGYEVCRQLKADAALKDIPVIFISALNGTIDKVKAFSVGGVDYVTKPLQCEEVYARVLTHLKLRRLEKLRDDLGQMFIHDLRSPLTSIFNFLKGMEGYKTQKLSDKDMELVTVARLSSEEMINMINSIIDVNKMGAGEMELQLESCRLDNLIRDLLDSNRTLYENCTVTFDAPGLPLKIKADLILIQRVVHNLLSNALKHTPTGGYVSIVVTSSISEVRVSVTDTGPGIERKYHRRIFEKFGHVENGKYRLGTGLGLTFCKMAVETLGGRIGVESEIGKGSNFWFVLPLLSLAQEYAEKGK